MKKLNLNSMKITYVVKPPSLDNFFNSINNKHSIIIVSNKDDNTFFFSDIPVNESGYLSTTYIIPFTISCYDKIIILNNKSDIIKEYYRNMTEIENPFKK